MKSAAIFLAFLAPAADSASSGIIGSVLNPICWDATAPIGCRNYDWINNDHLRCRDMNIEMHWAGEPVYTNMYTLRTKDGSSTYVPGKWTSIVLQVNSYSHKFRGLALHASNATEKFVGTWRPTGNDEENRHYWTPTAEKHCIMHAQADLKPLISEFRFRGPPKGTGSITIYALIKQGPANFGFFYYPNGNQPNRFPLESNFNFPGSGTNLVLTETAEDNKWGLANPGESCEEFCFRNGRQMCNETALGLESLNNPSGMEASIAASTGCPLPYIPSCAAVAPARSTRGACYYNGADSRFRSSVCRNFSPLLRSRCTAKHINASRICACMAIGSVQLQSLNDDEIDSEGESEIKDSPTSATIPQGRSKTANRLRFNGGVLPIFLSGLILVASSLFASLPSPSFNRAGRFGPSVMMTALSTLFLMAQPSEAHNWMRSDGRARFEASTTNPFRQRRLTDIHAQLGPGQEMSIKWATGHSRDHYFVVISGQDDRYLFSNQYKGWVQQYLAEAPAGSNQAASKPRLHSCRTDANCQDQTYFAGEITSNDADYCNYPPRPSAKLYRWRNEWLRNDAYVYYDSVNFPWIIGALRYNNIAHMPADEDVACLPVPAKPGKGQHYMVHWFWRGYYDVVDVHVHPNPVPVESIYGTPSDGFILTKIDHCQFVKPQAIASPIVDATRNISGCLEQIARPGRNQRNIEGTLGFNVVPIVNPSSTSIDIRNIPLKLDVDEISTFQRWPRDYIELALAGSPEVDLGGTETSSDYAFQGSSVTIMSGTRCTSGNRYSTFNRAIGECLRRWQDTDSPNCWGIDWERRGLPQTMLTKDNRNSGFRICQGSSSANTQANANYEVYNFEGLEALQGPSPTATAPGFINPTTWTNAAPNHYRISFQPASATFQGSPVVFTLPGNEWLVDNGAVYGDRGSGVPNYGWRGCSMTMAVNTRNPTLSSAANGNVLSGKIPLTGGWRTQCNGAEPQWEIALPNGVWVVTIRVGGGQIRGSLCVAENQLFNSRSFDEQYNTKSFEVEITDGRFTLTQPGGLSPEKDGSRRDRRECPEIFWIKFDRLQNAWPAAPVPVSTTEAWHQKDLGTSSPVGLVVIRSFRLERRTPDSFPNPSTSFDESCTHWWFFRTPKCKVQRFLYNHFSERDQNDFDQYRMNYARASNSLASPETRGRRNSAVPAGTFEGANDGFTVALSDTPCGSGGCPSKNTQRVCEVVKSAPFCEYEDDSDDLCTFVIDCRGQRGRYVRIYAGAQRFLPIDSVGVYRSELASYSSALSEPDSAKSKICYGVEARNPTETSPEFLISEDPSDPIFYSTCYIRAPNVSWIPLQQQAQLTRPNWAFNGRCLSCDSFARNNPQAPGYDLLQTPNWFLDEPEVCRNCYGELPAWGELGSAPTPAPTVQNAKLWRVVLGIQNAFDGLTESFKRVFKLNLARFLGVELGSFELRYEDANPSTNAVVTFVGTDAERRATDLGKTEASTLGTQTNTTITSISEPEEVSTGGPGNSGGADDGDELAGEFVIPIVILVVGVIVLLAGGFIWHFCVSETKKKVTNFGMISKAKETKQIKMGEVNAQSSAVALAPQAAAGSATSDSRQPAQSDGSAWTQHFDDKTGQPYWYNPSTGESSWESPST